MDISADERRRDFAIWLRTGRWPPRPEAVELKFNPWHDPADGRFTFAGSGQYFGRGDGGEAKRAGGRDRPNSAAELVGGFGESLYDAAVGSARAAYSALTTNPVTTVRDTGRAMASAIDTAIAADDTPARIQISRAADAVANASARDIGRAAGSVVANTALTVAPGAALVKVSRLRSLRAARSRPTFDPPQIGWVKENLGKDTPAKRYNDAADGARPGQAPTLMRTMPDGSKRPVKFDGVRGDYLIDRKMSVSRRSGAVAQLLRQSEVLAQHRSIGVWEVPNEAERIAAVRLFKKYNVTNINVRIVKP